MSNMSFSSASCATIVRLRYLSLYSNPAEFMFSTGKIGLWSIIEEGIGIIAGSLHALRPLLSLACLGRSTTNNSDSNDNTASAGKFKASRTPKGMRPDINLDTFQQLGDVDGDGDSQKHILKETQVSVMSSARTAPPEEWERRQVLGWK